MVTKQLLVCVFAVIYRVFIWKYVIIFQDVIQLFEVLKKKRFSLPEDKNRIDSLGVSGVGWWVLMVWI